MINKGYFGVGVEGISKAGNAGNLLRTTHAFGGSFFVTVRPSLSMQDLRIADTSGGLNMPLYNYESPEEIQVPKECKIVGIELTDDAIELPTFRHPKRALYMLGPEKASLSPAMQERCNFIIKIPMKFCVNVGVAGAITIYDRMISLGRFAERPVRVGGPTEELKPHVHGGRFKRIHNKGSE